MRIAIVAPTLGILGGHAVQALSMMEGWKDEPDVEAWLVPINPEPARVLRRLRNVKYARTLATQLAYWPLLVRELRGADVAHVFSASYSGFLLSAAPAILVAKAVGTPVVLNYHSGEAREHLAGSVTARQILRHFVDLHVVPSRFLREVFAGFGLAAQVVPNSIDVGRFPYRPRNPLRPHLLSTRNFEPVYNVSCTLKAFAHVQVRHPEATLTMVGSGPEEARLRALARELGLRDVTFAGRVPPAEMPGYYAAADVYVQTPASDNMPVSVLEAFASGLPVVSTDVGGVSSVLMDGVHGVLAGHDDDHAVAEAVLRLLASPDAARQMAATARESCRAYEWPAVRTGWIEAYRTVLRNTSRRASVSAEAA